MYPSAPDSHPEPGFRWARAARLRVHLTRDDHTRRAIYQARLRRALEQGHIKYVIAIGAGALHGLGYGDDAKAALITRGLAEISRLGVAFGAKPLTFIGLSGVGDLIVTATSVHSRNWRAGNELGQGMQLQEVIDTMGMVIEGIPSTKAAYELAQQKHIEMPITEAIYDVLYNDKGVKEVIDDLMHRDGKSELE